MTLCSCWLIAEILLPQLFNSFIFQSVTAQNSWLNCSQIRLSTLRICQTQTNPVDKCWLIKHSRKTHSFFVLIYVLKYSLRAFYQFWAQMLPFTCCSGCDPQASFVVLFPVQLRSSPVWSVFEISSNRFLSCWDAVIIPHCECISPVTGIWHFPISSLPLCLISQEPASTKSCRQTWEVQTLRPGYV